MLFADLGTRVTAPTQPSTANLAEFGMDLPDWLALMAAQNGACAGCLKPFTRKRTPQKDHDHRTGKMRGLLCFGCNTALGLRHDDAGWFERMSNYLYSPPADEVFVQPRLHRDAPPIGTA